MNDDNHIQESAEPSLDGGKTSHFDKIRSKVELKVKYLRDLPSQFEGIKSILEEKDFHKIKKEAHRIKGTSGTYKLDSISQNAAHIEYLASKEDKEAILNTINKIMNLVDEEFNRLNVEIISVDSEIEG